MTKHGGKAWEMPAGESKRRGHGVDVAWTWRVGPVASATWEGEGWSKNSPRLWGWRAVEAGPNEVKKVS